MLPFDSPSREAWETFADVGSWLVIIGVAGEGVEILLKIFERKWQRLNKWYEKHEFGIDLVGAAFWILVVLGLMIELRGNSKARIIADRENKELVNEAAKAKRDAALANERTSKTEVVAKKLDIQLTQVKTQLTNAETRLLEVQYASQPMDIGEEVSFADALKHLAGIQVELRSAPDGKAQQTAELLGTVFGMAGWPIINSRFIGDIGMEGVAIGCNGDQRSVEAASLLLKTLTDRNVPSEVIRDPFGHRVRGVPTNSIIVAVMPRPDPLHSQLKLVNARRDIISDERRRLERRGMELALRQYRVGSQELADAQTEYSSISSQLLDLDRQEQALHEQERKLYDELDKSPESHPSSPGVHMFNTKLPSGLSATNVFAVSSNSTVIVHGAHFNSVPLE